MKKNRELWLACKTLSPSRTWPKKRSSRGMQENFNYWYYNALPMHHQPKECKAGMQFSWKMHFLTHCVRQHCNHGSHTCIVNYGCIFFNSTPLAARWFGLWLSADIEWWWFYSTSGRSLLSQSFVLIYIYTLRSPSSRLAVFNGSRWRCHRCSACHGWMAEDAATHIQAAVFSKPSSPTPPAPAKCKHRTTWHGNWSLSITFLIVIYFIQQFLISGYVVVTFIFIVVAVSRACFNFCMLMLMFCSH